MTVHRKPGEKLGLELGTLDGKTLLVIAVKPGLVSEMNKMHPETPIAAGDFILSVNGIKDSVEAMKTDLSGKDTLELIVAPFQMVLKRNPQQTEEQGLPTADVTVKIENKKALDLGLKVSSLDGHTLQVVSIMDGFLKSHNEMVPEAGIFVGDTIAAVHSNDTDIQGDARQLLLALAKLGSGVLTLRRKVEPTPEPPAVTAAEETQEVQPKPEKEPEAEGQQEAAEVAPVEAATESQQAAEEVENTETIEPLKQADEEEVSTDAPAVILDGAQVRRGGIFAACCAPKVDAGEVQG